VYAPDSSRIETVSPQSSHMTRPDSYSPFETGSGGEGESGWRSSGIGSFRLRLRGVGDERGVGGVGGGNGRSEGDGGEVTSMRVGGSEKVGASVRVICKRSRY
jgi:hypothetical protein